MTKPHTATVLCRDCGTYHLDHSTELYAEIARLQEELRLERHAAALLQMQLSQEVERLRAAFNSAKAD